jgi:hypothetical protein
MANIIWLASYPRSGNIWLQAFLHNLMRDARQAPSLQEIGEFCTPETAALHFMTASSSPLGTWSREEMAERRAGAHQAITEMLSDNVFASTRAALVERDGAPTITMEYTVAAIYVVRNPLDLAVSLAAAHGQSIDEAISHLETTNETENTDQFAYEFHGNWSTHVLSWTQQRHAGLHLLRYEDMLASPIKAFAPLVSFLGVNSPADRLARAIQYSSFAELAARRESAAGDEENLKCLFRKGTSEQWRDILSVDQVGRIIDCHKEQMTRFDYIPDGY